jgi:hypothetical protein
MATKRDDVRTLLDRYSTTYAEEEGIRLADKPSPLYRLLVVALLLSARIAHRRSRCGRPRPRSRG